MPIRDNQIGWKAKRVFLGVETMNMIGAAGSSAGAESGAPVVAAAAGASALAVVQMGAAGDEVVIAQPIPWDLDRDKPVLGRIWFIHSSTDADTPDWLVTSKFHAKQATVVATDTSGDATATYAATACSTTNESLEVTAWKNLGWDSKVTSTDILFQLLIECNGLGSASANEIELIGFELMYKVKATQSVPANITHELGANSL